MGFTEASGALQAIRRHVDDYLAKPADIEYLLRTIKEKLREPRPTPALPVRRLASTFRENVESMLEYVLEGMKTTPGICGSHAFEVSLVESLSLEALKPPSPLAGYSRGAA